MRRHLVSVLALIGFALAALGSGKRMAAGGDAGPTAAATTAAGKSGLRILPPPFSGQGTVKAEAGMLDPMGKVKTYGTIPPTAGTIRARVEGCSAAKKIAVAFIAEDVDGAPKESVINAVDADCDPRASAQFWDMKAKSKFAVGRYRVEMRFDDELVFWQRLEVK
jgi:hypothetical protein